MAEPQRRHAGLLEARRGCFDSSVELEDVAPRPLHFDEFGNARLAVGLDRGGKTEFARLVGQIADHDSWLQMKTDVK